eukprot:scaffold342053_cov20-Prasinocladus_malaysianus.AAC.1
MYQRLQLAALSNLAADAKTDAYLSVRMSVILAWTCYVTRYDIYWMAYIAHQVGRHANRIHCNAPNALTSLKCICPKFGSAAEECQWI